MEFSSYEKWLAALVRKPDWYLEFVPKVAAIKKELNEKKEAGGEKFKKFQHQLYQFFETQLEKGNVALGSGVGHWDKERAPIDTIVIHHSKGKPGITKERLSAIELVRLYAPYYANPYDKNDIGIRGKPISSGHVRDGKQIFYPYHWGIRTNGETSRLLYDEEVGWQAGKWEINCRSIAIVFDNNYENSSPSEVELKAAAAIIREHYPQVPKERIFGHQEVRPSPTTCPSKLFLSTIEHRGWKEDLLELI